jgi:hypothetical protein
MDLGAGYARALSSALRSVTEARFTVRRAKNKWISEKCEGNAFRRLKSFKKFKPFKSLKPRGEVMGDLARFA